MGNDAASPYLLARTLCSLLMREGRRQQIQGEDEVSVQDIFRKYYSETGIKYNLARASLNLAASLAQGMCRLRLTVSRACKAQPPGMPRLLKCMSCCYQVVQLAWQTAQDDEL